MPFDTSGFLAPKTNDVPFRLTFPAGVFAADAGSNVKFGWNPTITTASDPEDVWSGGGLYTGQPSQDASAETVDVISGSDDDSENGTGARTIEIQGLDSNWDEATETLTLNGTSGVTSTTQFHRVYRGIVKTAGSGGVNAGAITCQHTTTTANIFFVMVAGYNQTTVAAVTVPRNKGFLLTSAHCAISLLGGGSSVSAVIRLLIREPGATYRSFRVEQVSPGSPYDEQFDPGAALAPMTDILFRVDSVSATAAVSARFGYYYGRFV